MNSYRRIEKGSPAYIGPTVRSYAKGKADAYRDIIAKIKWP